MTDREAYGGVADEGSGSSRGGWSRWFAVAAVVALGIAAVVLLFGGGDAGEADNRAATLALTEPELAAVSGADDLRRVNPPLDLGMVERTAKAATLGQVPLPESRHMNSYKNVDTGEEINEAVLVYDDIEAAASLDGIAAPLLGSALGLQSEPLEIPETQDARRWTGAGVQAATFRVGGVVLVVSTTSADPAELMDLAVLARDKASRAEAPAGTEGDG